MTIKSILDGKYNSTAIKNEKKVSVKEEPADMNAVGIVTKNWADDDRYYSSEYSSSFNPNDSSNFLEESERHNDSFPLPLNPLFDLQALVMVSQRKYLLKTKLTVLLVWYLPQRAFLRGLLYFSSSRTGKSQR